MTRTNSMLIRWRVQVRTSRTAKWRNLGLFETREVARAEALFHRDYTLARDESRPPGGYGFGNTRVLRHEGKGKP